MRHYMHVGITAEIKKNDDVFDKLSVLSYAVDQLDMVDVRVSYLNLDTTNESVQNLIDKISSAADFKEIYETSNIAFYPNDAMIPVDAPIEILDAYLKEDDNKVIIYIPLASMGALDVVKDGIVSIIKMMFGKDLLLLKIEEVANNQSYKDRRTYTVA